MPFETPILNSCCCWSDIHTACYASAIYSFVYFLITTITISHFLYEEWLYLSGNGSYPISSSFLEPGSISKNTMYLNVVLLIVSILGLISALLLIVGLLKNNRCFLTPWIVIMAADIILELIHSTYMYFLEAINFNPITGILFTLDFFLVIIHIYALLCVISQYQIYKMGALVRAPSQTRSVRVTSTGESRAGLISAVSRRSSDISQLCVEYTAMPYAPTLYSGGSKTRRNMLQGRGVTFRSNTMALTPIEGSSSLLGIIHEGELKSPGPDKTTAIEDQERTQTDPFAEIVEMVEGFDAQNETLTSTYRALGPLRFIAEVDEDVTEEDNDEIGTLNKITEEDEESFKLTDVVVHEYPRED